VREIERNRERWREMEMERREGEGEGYMYASNPIQGHAVLVLKHSNLSYYKRTTTVCP